MSVLGGIENSGITFDWTISISNIIATLGIVGAALGFFIKLIRRMDNISNDVERVEANLANHVHDVQSNIEEVRQDFKALERVLTAVAVQEQRMTGIDARMNELSKRLDKHVP